MDRKEAIIDTVGAVMLCVSFFAAFWVAAAMDVTNAGM
tara:strand:- start:323 stop:436 length:114 start_codon:yes stop_codon:yes gene_type:complete